MPATPIKMIKIKSLLSHPIYFFAALNVTDIQKFSIPARKALRRATDFIFIHLHIKPFKFAH